jgi:hypothetical protein
VKKVARQFLEVLDFADFVHLVDDAVQHRLDFLVRFFLKERPLEFQPALVPEEFFLIKIRDALSFLAFEFHEGRDYNSKLFQPASFFRSRSFTVCGFARPPVAFMTWPTKKPKFPVFQGDIARQVSDSLRLRD